MKKEYNIYQCDEFTPEFKIASFDNKEQAEENLSSTIKESAQHDEFTCFFIKEENIE